MTKTNLVLRSLIALLFVVSLAPSKALAAGSDIKWAISGPLTLVEGNATWGAYIDAFFYNPAPDFEIGVESGFFIRSETFGTTSVTAWNIPILATGIYHFTLQGSSDIKPFVGASLGLAIVHGSAGALGSDTSAKFQGHAHLGANFGAIPGFFADIRLGFLDSSFNFGPTVGYMW